MLKDFGVGDVHVATALGNQPKIARPTSRSRRAKRRKIKNAKSFDSVIAKFNPNRRAMSFDAIIAKFSPDQPRAPKGDPKGGQWVETGQADDPTGLEVYHGGTTANLDAILKEGLKPAPTGVRGADWLAEHVMGMPVQDILDGANNRPKSVFFTESLDTAQSFANLLAGKAEEGTFYGAAAVAAKPVVLKIEIPASMKSAVLNDEAYGPTGRGAYRMESAIKPEWIKGYMLPKDSQFHTGHHIDFGVEKADTFTIYAVVFDRAAIAKYSPDQARAPKGDPKGGQWVDAETGAPQTPAPGDVILYHGTQDQALASILKEGLVPGEGKGILMRGDKLGGTRDGSVFMTTSLDGALTYAGMVGYAAGAEALVLKVDVPAASIGNIFRDEADASLGGGKWGRPVRYVGSIPPDWIVGYQRAGKDPMVRAMQDHMASRGIERGVGPDGAGRWHPTLKSASQTIYVVILCDGGVAKYSPDQPRVPAGESAGGQWTGDAGAEFTNAPVDGAIVSVETEGNPSAKFQNEVKKDIDDLPPDLKELLAKDGVKVQIVDKFTTAYPDAVGHHPDGWPAYATVDDVAGGYNMVSKRLVLAEAGLHNGGYDTHGVDNLIYHEFGHAVDQALGISGSVGSAPKALSSAYAADAAALPIGTRVKINYFMPSNPHGIHEAVGEIIANGYGKASPGSFGVSVAKSLPRTTAYVEAKVKPALPSWGAGINIASKAFEKIMNANRRFVPIGGYVDDIGFVDGMVEVDGNGVKKYSPSQPREPAGIPAGGRWVGVSGAERTLLDSGSPYADYDSDIAFQREGSRIVAWHGTRAENIASILENGLTRPGGFFSKGSVYVTNTFKSALDWGRNLNYGRIAVFELSIPKGQWTKFDGSPVHAPMDIPPSWIKAVYKPTKDGVKRLKIGKAEGSVTAFAVIVVDRDDEVAKAELFADVMAKYSPDQQREPAGTPEGGRWTFMHGTSSTVLNKIKNEGLKPSIDGISEIYGTDDFGVAARYAQNVAEHGARGTKGKNGKPVVFKINVPRGEVGSFARAVTTWAGMVPRDYTVWSRGATIPPSWIEGYYDLGTRGFFSRHFALDPKEPIKGEFHSFKKDDDLSLFVPWVLDDDVAKYSPDQPREPKGDPEGGQFVAYHGTDKKWLSSILKDGIKPGGGGRVYVSDDPQEALIFANSALEGKVGLPVIFKIMVPENSDFMVSPRNIRENATDYRSNFAIPASWIKGYYEPRPSSASAAAVSAGVRAIGGGPETKHRLGTYHEIRKGDGKVYYVVVFPPTVAKYSPDQPRIPHGPGGGRWTDGSTVYDDGKGMDDEEGSSVDEIKRLAAVQHSSLEVEDAIRNYTESSDRINRALREGKVDFDSDTAGDQELFDILDLDAALARSSLPIDLTVYRGVDADTWASINKSLAPDGTFSDEGYVSTSLRKAIAYGSWVDQPLSAPPRVVMEIELPKGTHALAIDGKLTQWPSETEVLLPRGSTFKVNSWAGNGTRAKLSLVTDSPADRSGMSYGRALRSQAAKAMTDRSRRFVYTNADLVGLRFGVAKYNHHHDEHGLFATADGSAIEANPPALTGTGNCYKTAAKGVCQELFASELGEALKYADPKQLRLVQAMVSGQGPIAGRRFGHSWVEYQDHVYDFSNGNRVVMPTERYYALGKVGDAHYYTQSEAKKLMGKTKHFGPWA